MNSNLDPDMKIYRIMKQQHFFELFEKKVNVLAQPEKWDDPFENVILKSPILNTNNNQIGFFPFHKDVYGQCWSMEEDSDALWRIYSGSGAAVQIRTTVGKLYASLKDDQGEWAHTTCFIDPVEYLDEMDIKEVASSIFNDPVLPMTPTGIARSLLLKRRAFFYEREVRLIFIKSDSSKDECDFYKYKIDPDDLVEQVVADPRMRCKEDFDEFIYKVKRVTNLRDEQIKRSLIYQPPEGFIVKMRL